MYANGPIWHCLGTDFAQASLVKLLTAIDNLRSPGLFLGLEDYYAGLED